MESINQRINEIAIDYFSGNNSKFANFTGTSESNIRNYRKKTTPKVEFLETICEKLAINYEWIITGKGEKSSEKSSMNEYNDENHIVHDPPINYGCKMCREKDQRILDLKEMVKMQKETIQSLIQQIEPIHKQDSDLDDTIGSKTG